MFKLDLEKAEELEIKLATSIESLKKQESSWKNIYFYFIDYAKAFDCVDHNELWKILKEGNTRPPTWPASWEIGMQLKKQLLKWTWNNRLVPNSERSTSRLYIVTLLI